MEKTSGVHKTLLSCETGSAVEEKRKLQLESFYQRVLRRAQINPTELNIENIDKYYDQLQSTKYNLNQDLKSLEGSALFNVIENILKSNLRKCFIQRSTSQILENGNYGYWHIECKYELRKLMKILTKDQIRSYVNYCYNFEDKHALIKSLDKISNLKRLLIKREISRNNNIKYISIQKKIQQEWTRTGNIVEPELAVYYASNILKIMNSNVAWNRKF